MSASPDDLTPLTPSHFLIGKQAVSLPEPSVSSIPENCLSNYQLLLRLYEHFWLRWSREYISELQLRQRWKQNHGQLEKGQLVLVKDDNLPPTRWRLGRVEKLILGKDGIARVASLRTSDGIICRALARLCPLPVPGIDCHNVNIITRPRSSNSNMSPTATLSFLKSWSEKLKSESLNGGNWEEAGALDPH
nr:unnamed protein product [Callosobruchus chinensis]